MKIVFLDRKTIGEDIALTKFHAFGDLVEYDFSTSQEIPARIEDADIIITNKCNMNEETLAEAKNLKLICVTATGTNNLDKDYLDSHKIAWRNVAGYSTETVTQHTFAMLFYLLEKLRYYDDYVKDGNYINDTSFTHFAEHFSEINGKTWGIIGLGAIGRRVAQIARAFGANVIYYSASGRPAQDGYTQVDFDTLLTTSDIISVHAPLNEHTENLLDKCAFAKMKETCIFLNLGRGPIVVEQDLYDALVNGEIAAAGLDVLSAEPMSEKNPLIKIQDSRRLFITPHIAWASVEARTRLMQIILDQVKEYFHM